MNCKSPTKCNAKPAAKAISRIAIWHGSDRSRVGSAPRSGGTGARQAQKRLLRLQEQAQQLDVSTLEQELAGIDVKMETIQTALADTEAALAQQQEQVLALRDTTQDLSSRLHSANAEVSQANGRLASLEALQEAALDKGNADLHAWLHVQGLRDAPRLAETLQVAAGWEQAVETVLGTRVQAWCVSDLQPIVDGWQQAPQGQLMLLECQTASTALSHHLTSPLKEQGLTPLLAQVQAPSQLVSLLSGVWCVDSVQQAYALRGQLAAHESLLTRDGVWLGPDWLQSQQPNDDAHASVLAREQEISKLATQLQQLDALVARLTTELDQQRQALYHSEEQREQLQRQTNEIRQQHSHLQAQHGGKLARLESQRQQQQRNAEEREELQTQIEDDTQGVTETRERLHSALASMDSLADEREALTRQRDEYQEASRQLRTAWQQAQAQRHQIELKLQTQRSDSQGLQQAIERLQTRFDELHEQHHELVQMLEQQDDPLLGLREELEDKQQQKVEVEQALADVKLTVEHLEAALSQYEEERHTLESRSSELRANLEQARMDFQGDEVRRQTIDEQLAETRLPLPPEERTAEETEFTPTPMSLLAELPEYTDEDSWVSQIEAVERKVGKIGSVNMAALQEYEEQRERKQYLDEQAVDLEQALQILDNAIKTIDRETRTRFKNTLDTVNSSLQEMFPRLFGGGQATLELVGEDLLTAGVAIMARPPGKRNSTIHLLSGGEKALTAIALVFAIFELNPAPF